MKILITGNKGFIGSHLTKLYKKHQVDMIDIKEGKDLAAINTNHPKKQYDLIIHCASQCVVRECIQNPMMAHYNNAFGTLQLFEYARRNNCKKIIYFSSSRTLENEENPYTASKKYGECLCEAYHQCYNIDYIIIRPSTVYGEGDNTDRLIPRFIKNAKQGKTLEIYGDHKKTLDITYIEDFINAFKLIMKKGKWNTDYDVGNGYSISLYYIAYHIRRLLNSKSKIVYKQQEIAQPQQVKINNKKIVKLGYKQKYDFRLALKRTIRYYK